MPFSEKLVNSGPGIIDKPKFRMANKNLSVIRDIRRGVEMNIEAVGESRQSKEPILYRVRVFFCCCRDVSPSYFFDVIIFIDM